LVVQEGGKKVILSIGSIPSMQTCNFFLEIWRSGNLSHAAPPQSYDCTALSYIVYSGLYENHQ